MILFVIHVEPWKPGRERDRCPRSLPPLEGGIKAACTQQDTEEALRGPDRTRELSLDTSRQHSNTDEGSEQGRG